jgi:SRSO17 transposase
MIARALAAGAACAWVAGDEVYGNNNKLRTWLEEKQLGYVMAIACDQRTRWPDHQLRRVDEIARSLPALAWERLSAGEGRKGERLYDWTMITGWQQDGWTHGLLVRRSIEQEPEHAYYWFHARVAKATLGTLVRVAGQRWQIEQAFQAAKGECGRDHYEVRSWHGWYRHITLSMLAFAALVKLRSRGEKNSSGQVPLSVPELRHLLTHMLWRGWHGVEHLLHWSRWSRKHQFHALRCHYRKRGSPLPILYLQL